MPFRAVAATLVREGLIPAGPRTPAQARMELVIALSAGAGYGGGGRAEEVLGSEFWVLGSGF